jgi:hypothetical protein
MTPKQYLSQARYIDRRIESRIAERDRLMETVMAARAPQLTGMPSGGGGHDWTNTVDKAVDLTRQIDEDICRLLELKREIWAAIDAVEDARYRMVLELRYRAGYEWDAIAAELHYDIRWVYRLHGRALRAVHVPV